MTIIITSGGFNYAFSDIICTLFVFLYDTLMMVAEETETCRWIVYDKKIHKKKIQQDATVYQNFILFLYEVQHVSDATPPIIRSLKLH